MKFVSLLSIKIRKITEFMYVNIQRNEFSRGILLIKDIWKIEYFFPTLVRDTFMQHK